MSADRWEGSRTQKVLEAIVTGILIIVAIVFVTAWLAAACTAPKHDYPPGTDCYNDGFSTVCEP